MSYLEEGARCCSCQSSAAKLLDINSASKEELEALPAIGKVTSAAIIAGRPSGPKTKVKDMIIAKQK